MSVLTDLIYGGSNAVAGLTEGAVNDAIAKYGADKEIAFPDTAYFFPTIYAATGVKVKTLGDLPACVGVLKSLITNQEDLGQALNAGLATAVGAEILEGLKYVDGANPYENESGIGFVPDPIIRSLGVPLVTGDIPGVAVVLGKADNAEDVVKVVKDYQSKGIMTFMVGDVIEQCAEGGVKMGLELRVIPLGHDVTSVIHVVTVAIRAALIFGNVQPGNLAGLLDYTKNRVPAFVNTFGAIDSVVVSAGAGAIALGFPVVVDIDLGENQVPGALESVCDHAETVKKSLELRNIKIKVKELPIPVAFAAAFEGEIIRKADMHNEIWSAKNPTAELVVMRELNEIEDHKITIVGPDFDQAKDLALATYVEVAGKKMQVDFESVIERKFHAWFNYMEGVMHTGQRNQVRIRVSNAAYEAGLRLKDFAEVLYVMIMDEFDAVVDKCQITLITDAAEAKRILRDARATADQVFSELAEMRKAQAKAERTMNANEARANLFRQLNEAEDAATRRDARQEPIPKPSRPIRVGDLVEFPGVRQPAEVVSVGKDGTLQLKAGVLKLKAKANEVRLIEDDERAAKKKAPAVTIRQNADRALRASVPRELDIRGLETLEAESVVENFLSAAVMAHLETVTIIHGKGTGALRKAVQAYLRRDKTVKSFRLGNYGEGESGVTVVEFK